MYVASDLVDVTLLGDTLGEVEVTTRVMGFKKKQQFTEEVIGEEPLDLPPIVFPTIAVWFDLPPKVAAVIDKAELDFAGGLHAAMLMLYLLGILAGCTGIAAVIAFLRYLRCLMQTRKAVVQAVNSAT